MVRVNRLKSQSCSQEYCEIIVPFRCVGNDKILIIELAKYTQYLLLMRCSSACSFKAIEDNTQEEE